MADPRLTNLRDAILRNVSEAPGGLTVTELEDRLRHERIPYWQGEVQEVLWRLTAAKHLKVTPTGKFLKEQLVGHGGS